MDKYTHLTSQAEQAPLKQIRPACTACPEQKGRWFAGVRARCTAHRNNALFLGLTNYLPGGFDNLIRKLQSGSPASIHDSTHLLCATSIDRLSQLMGKITPVDEPLESFRLWQDACCYRDHDYHIAAQCQS